LRRVGTARSQKRVAVDASGRTTRRWPAWRSGLSLALARQRR